MARFKTRQDLYQDAVGLMLGRTQAALDRQANWAGEPYYNAEMISKLIALLEDATPAPWKVADEAHSGENWILATTGHADDVGQVYITTDHIHASELVSGGAEEDANLIVTLRNHARWLLKLVQAQQMELLKLRVKVVHPDMGGDAKEFARVQKAAEELGIV